MLSVPPPQSLSPVAIAAHARERPADLCDSERPEKLEPSRTETVSCPGKADVADLGPLLSKSSPRQITLPPPPHCFPHL